jgi:outer membrane receptor protein involved in Fe transport
VFRGVAASGLSFGGNSSSSIYLDEQPITSAGDNPDPRLVDIERIEALSGPQGTLFGASSQSGTLRIITNKPDTKERDAWVEMNGTDVSGGSTGYDVSGMVNVPLAENKVALRFVGFAAQDAGYIDNVLSTSPATCPRPHGEPGCTGHSAVRRTSTAPAGQERRQQDRLPGGALHCAGTSATNGRSIWPGFCRTPTSRASATWIRTSETSTRCASSRRRSRTTGGRRVSR